MVTLQLNPITAVGGDWLNLVLHGDRWSLLLSLWQRWDALWYQQIAEHGYHATDGTPHFQPLYPLLVRLVSVSAGAATVVAQLIVSTVACVIALRLLYRLAMLDVPPDTARLAVLLLAAFPTAFFLMAPYTESLYLALTVSSFWFARSGKPWMAGLAGAGAALTRVLGIFLVIPLLYICIQRRHERGRSPWSLDVLAASLPVLALMALNLYQRFVVGESRSQLELAKQWGQRIVGPAQPLLDSLHFINRTGDPIEMLNVLCLLGFSVLAILSLWRLPLVYSLYTLPYLAFLASEELLISPLASVCRYALVLFPCFIVLAQLLRRTPALAAGTMALSWMLQITLFEHWVRFGFVA